MKFHDILFGSRPKSISKIIEKGNLEELKIFIENEGNVNSKYDDKSLLHFAIDNCENNYAEVIEFLIKNLISSQYSNLFFTLSFLFSTTKRLRVISLFEVKFHS